MIELNEQLLDHQLAPATRPVVDKIYAQAYEYLQVKNMIKIVYAAAKILTVPIFLPITSSNTLFVWLIGVFTLSSIQLSHYLRIRKKVACPDLYYRIAERLRHCVRIHLSELSPELHDVFPRVSQRQDYTQHEQGIVMGQQGDEQRKMRVLAEQIKGVLQEEYQQLFMAGRVLFVVYIVLHVWGVMLFFLLEDKDNQLAITYLSILVFLSTYEYLQFYLFLFFIILVLPFWLLKNLYNHLKHRYKLYRLQRMLKGITYHKGAVKDHEECKICLQQYQDNQDIVVLKCFQLHHFHAACFRLWADNSLTCPMCRSEVSPP